MFDAVTFDGQRGQWSVATDPSSDLSSRHIRQPGRRVITRQLIVFSRDVANTD